MYANNKISLSTYKHTPNVSLIYLPKTKIHKIKSIYEDNEFLEHFVFYIMLVFLQHYVLIFPNLDQYNIITV